MRTQKAAVDEMIFMWYIIPKEKSDELFHYGIKGMKWGVRRTKEQLKYDRHSIQAKVNRALPSLKTTNNVKVRSISEHALDKIESDDDRKVTAAQIVNALEKPLNIGKTKFDKYGRPSIRYTGEHATVNVNPMTCVISTVWKTSHKKAEKLKTNRKGG